MKVSGCAVWLLALVGGIVNPNGLPAESQHLFSAPAQGAESAQAVRTPQDDPRPNILLVVLDDIGFTDLGPWGGVIETPNIDALAREGVLFTQFHASPTCSPTRAMLLSGTDSHVAGLGSMAGNIPENQRGQPGYEGYLNFRVATLPEVLRDGGYHTYMTGKWHLGMTPDTGPQARGFERSFALLPAGAGSFANRLPIVGPEPAQYREDGELVDVLPDGFYATTQYTEKLIEYIESNRTDGQPFFAYLAYTAAHWPLQAPDTSVTRQRGRFDEGYDAYRERRLERLVELGFYRPGVTAFPRLPAVPVWDELSLQDRRAEARKMEVYAAMVADLDRHLGKIIDYLRSIGEYDNTFLFLLSDNGPEGHDLAVGWPELASWVAACCDNRLANLGRPESYVWYGGGWGQAGSTPLRMYKGFTSQGGINVPAIARFPRQVPGGRRTEAVTHVMDVMPTLLELAGLQHPGPGDYRGRTVVGIQGISLLPLLRGDDRAALGARDYLGWELFGKRAIRRGEWKIVYVPQHDSFDDLSPDIVTDRWQLFHVTEDPAELRDLAAVEPARLRELVALWEDYSRANNVILPAHSSGY